MPLPSDQDRVQPEPWERPYGQAMNFHHELGRIMNPVHGSMNSVHVTAQMDMNGVHEQAGRQALAGGSGA